MSTDYLKWLWTGSDEPCELAGQMTIGAGDTIVAVLPFAEFQDALAFSKHIDSLISQSYDDGMAEAKRVAAN